MQRTINLSIVVPVFNEEENIRPLYQKIKTLIALWPWIGSYEIIFVDDASTDGSVAEGATINDSSVKWVYSKERRGQSRAIEHGIKAARYEVVATLDADLQNDPRDIPDLLAYLDKGYDFVQGWRFERNDPFIRKISSRIANAVRRLLLKDSFHDISCSLRVFNKRCVEKIVFFDGSHRFLPYLVQQEGFNVAECKVHHLSRTHGVSKYNVRNRIFKAFRDAIRLSLQKKSRRA